MGIGGGIFLIAVGAILKFAVNVHTKGVDLNTIGVILMIAGGAALLLDLIFFAPRRRTVRTVTSGAAPSQTVVQDTNTFV